MMPTLTLDEILTRVGELKREGEEKDEVIRVQQVQIDELESRIQDLESQIEGLRNEKDDLARQNGELNERIEQIQRDKDESEAFMLNRLSEALGETL